MSTISQIVAMHKRAAQVARGSVASVSPGSPGSESALVTLGAATAAATYSKRIKRTGNINVDALLADGKRWIPEDGAEGSRSTEAAGVSVSVRVSDSGSGSDVLPDSLAQNPTDGRTGELSTTGSLSQAGIEAMKVWDGVSKTAVGKALCNATA